MTTPAIDQKILELPIDSIRPDPNQPRRDLDKEQLKSLTASVQANGVLQPIIVRALPDNARGWMIVAGERRWRAAKACGLKVVPAMLQDGDDVAIAAVQLAENMERENLSDIDIAEFLNELRTKKGATYADMAKALEDRGLGLFNAKALERWLKLVELPDWAKELMRAGAMSREAALAVLPANQNAKWCAALGKSCRETAKRSGHVVTADVQQDLRWTLREVAISLDATYPENLVRKFPREDCKGCTCLITLGKEMYCTDRKAFDAKNKAALKLEAEKEKAKAERGAKGKSASGRDNPDPTKVEPRDVSKFENKHGVVMKFSKGLGRNTFESLAGARFETAKICRRCPHKHPAAINEDDKRGDPTCFHPPCFNANQGKARRDELAADKVGTWLDGWLRPRVLDWALVDLSVDRIYGVVYWLALGAPGGYYGRREAITEHAGVACKTHAVLDFARALEYGADAAQDGAREEGLLRLAVKLMDADELRWFAREFVGVKLEADRYGFAIDDAYLQLMRKAQLEKLAEIGGLGPEFTEKKLGVADLRKAIVESPGCIERIGVPVDVADVYATSPERGSWRDWDIRMRGEDDDVKLAGALDAAALKKAEAIYGKLGAAS